MIKETLERRIGWAGDPAADQAWCREWGWRAYVMGLPGSAAIPGLLILDPEGTVTGVAEPGDTLAFDGDRIVIRRG